jgi:hypothetical protein
VKLVATIATAAIAAVDRALSCESNESDRDFLLQRRGAIASERREAS